MKNKWSFVLLFLVIIALSWLANRPKAERSSSDDGLIFYYSVTCSYCKVVEEWLNNNPALEEKSGLVRKEVSRNRANNEELLKKAQECQIDTDQGFGIPFLYDRGKCITGDQPIIDYLAKYQ